MNGRNQSRQGNDAVKIGHTWLFITCRYLRTDASGDGVTTDRSLPLLCAKQAETVAARQPRIHCILQLYFPTSLSQKYVQTKLPHGLFPYENHALMPLRHFTEHLVGACLGINSKRTGTMWHAPLLQNTL